MDYVRAMSATKRGYCIRRAAWLDPEFIRVDDDAERIIRITATEAGLRNRTFIASIEDMFASDWELVTA